MRITWGGAEYVPDRIFCNIALWILMLLLHRRGERITHFTAAEMMQLCVLMSATGCPLCVQYFIGAVSISW